MGVKGDCGDCRFFQPKGNDPENVCYGQCRRYAPRPRVDNGEAETVWPNVGADQWCGEFQPEASE